MANFVTSGKERLKRRHYVLRANQAGHWFNVSPNVLERYKRQFGEDFCIVLFKDGSVDNAFVLPYGVIKDVLTYDNLIPSGGNSFRWMGSISHGHLNIRNSDKRIPVQKYHNAFELL